MTGMIAQQADKVVDFMLRRTQPPEAGQPWAAVVWVARSPILIVLGLIVIFCAPQAIAYEEQRASALMAWHKRRAYIRHRRNRRKPQ